ncbi:MAG: TatD family hydrolase [Ignisphaera sp.]|uniref:Hydrolase TatD n=1 Tax=Ignisphaera aggregans TaxID=334771 RepID=A0A7C4NL08_9CREN
MTRILFADGHLHSNPIKGMGMNAIAKKLTEIGGWFVALVLLPPYHYGFENTFEGYLKAVDVLISECKTSRELGLRAVCLAGVHPAAIEDEISINTKASVKVLEKAIKVIDYVAKLVREGVLHGFGEIGRPHYKASPEAFIVNNIVTRYALTLAKDLGASVHLHLEQGGELTALDIENNIKSLGIDERKVIMHHADVSTAKAAQARNLVSTVPGKYPILKEVFKSLKPYYMVESDYIDDLKRPGVSSYPWEIVENQKKLLNEGIVDEEYLYKLNIDMILKVYEVKPP